LVKSTGFCNFAAENLKIMTGKLPKDDHRELFRTRLADLINPQHELALLANTMDWKYFEEGFKKYYTGNNGRPSMPIRLMVGVWILSLAPQKKI
jgi:IS5 family transposase